jgi:hypothetical protein
MARLHSRALCAPICDAFCVPDFGGTIFKGSFVYKKRIGGMARGLILAGAASLLVACGGGGGGGGSGSPLIPNPSNPLSLTFSSDRTYLPLNLQNDPAAIGSPYTATINVRGSYVPGGGPAGGNCWTAEFFIISGAPSGSLSSPDLPAFMGGMTNYFAVSSSGNWNVLLNASDRAGVVTIEVAVPNPDTAVVTCNDDKVEVGARFAGTPITYIRKQYQVQVGAASSGLPAQVVLNRQAPNYLYVQGMNGPTQMLLQARIVDEAGQPVPDSLNNLRARIVPDPNTTAEDNARLFVGASSVGAGQWISTSTINGQALLSVSSGNSLGVLAVEVATTRISNGVAIPITNVAAIPVVSTDPANPLVITTTALVNATTGSPYAAALGADGGTPPYYWSLAPGSSLPAGLELGVDGSLSGTITAPVGSYAFSVEVFDSAFQNRGRVVRTYTLTVTAPLTISGNPPNGQANVAYSATLTASGGTAPYTWSIDPTLGLNLATSGATAVISGVPNAAGTVLVTLEDANGVQAQPITFTISPAD